MTVNANKKLVCLSNQNKHKEEEVGLYIFFFTVLFQVGVNYPLYLEEDLFLYVNSKGSRDISCELRKIGEILRQQHKCL